MKALLFSILLIPFLAFSQQPLDKKITVNYVDTSGLYQRLKTRLIKDGYNIKFENSVDSIVTNPKTKVSLGYLYLITVIKGNTITFSGYYSKRTNHEGYKPIIYFEHDAGMGWREMRKTALAFGGDFDFSK